MTYLASRWHITSNTINVLEARGGRGRPKFNESCVVRLKEGKSGGARETEEGVVEGVGDGVRRMIVEGVRVGRRRERELSSISRTASGSSKGS